MSWTLGPEAPDYKRAVIDATRMHPLIWALMQHLPPAGTSWPTDKQRRFMAALEASVRLLYDVTPDPTRRKHPVFNVEPPY